MDVKADLAGASRFSEYDSSSNAFKVHSHLVQAGDVGTYVIKIQVKFFNDYHEESFNGQFLLTITDDLLG